MEFETTNQCRVIWYNWIPFFRTDSADLSLSNISSSEYNQYHSPTCIFGSDLCMDMDIDN